MTQAERALKYIKADPLMRYYESLFYIEGVFRYGN